MSPERAVEELARARIFSDDWQQANHGGEYAAAVDAGVLAHDLDLPLIPP